MSLTATQTAPVHHERRLKLVKNDAAASGGSTTGDYPSRPDRTTLSKQRLLEHVTASIAEMYAEDGGLELPSNDALLAFFRLIDHLLADNSPTPQISPGPDDGLAVEWLVNGHSMTIFFQSEADIHVWAEDSDGSEVFDYELTSKWSPTDPRIGEMSEYLARLSGEVVARADLRTYR